MDKRVVPSGDSIGAAQPPRVSVLIAAYNAAPFLGAAIESILAQTLRDFELVVVDDGSGDDSATIAEAYAARDPRVRIFRREHSGIAATSNFGLSVCRAELVARLDADDISVPDRLEKQVAWMSLHPSVAALGGAVCYFFADGRRDPPIQAPATPAEVRTALLTRNVLFNNTMMFRRSVVLAVGGYRSAFDTAEDYDLWLRLMERAEIATIPDVLTYYRQHPGQVTSRFYARQGGLAEIAQIAAVRRGQGKADPFDGLGRIDAGALAALGLPADRERRLRARLENRSPDGRLPVRLLFLRPFIQWARLHLRLRIR